MLSKYIPTPQSRRYIILVFIVMIIKSGWTQVNYEKLDTFIEKKVSESHFEGAILIAENGLIKYSRAFGHSDFEQKVGLTTQTRFGIASITKMITSIIIMQLVDEKKIELSQSVAKLLPSFNIPNGDSITLHHLLLHISGLPNESNDIYFMSLSSTQFVKKTLSDNTLNQLGTFNYANIDYVLLGLVIESITGRSWEEVVRDRILVPINMSNTGFLSKELLPNGYSGSYTYDAAGKRLADPLFNIENYYAAGNMYSTTADLLKLDQAMYDPKFLSEAARDQMFKSYPEYNYTGYGVWTYQYPFVDTYPLIMERRGGILGSNNVLIRFLESNKTIIILSNNNQFNPDSFGDPNNLREALIRYIGR